jgi:spore germination cell wall hydrolase CwlJ-like protein
MLGKFWIILSLFYSTSVFAGEYSEVNCLAANIYFEARGESHRGMQAVAEVTINRTRHKAFKGQGTICKVVLAPSQFSWVKLQPRLRVKKLLKGDVGVLKDKDLAAYQLAKEVAVEALNEGYKPLLPQSVVSFHNASVAPLWSKTMKRYGRIGRHTFYSFKH